MVPDKLTITLRPRSLLKGMLLSPAAVLLGYWVWSWPWDSGNAPAWVQAVGSIGAILAAVWVAAHQNRQQLRLIRRQEAETLKKVVAVAKYVGKVNQAAGDQLSEQVALEHQLRLITEGLKRSLALLDEVPYHLVPESEASIGWIELRFATTGLVELIGKYYQDEGFGAEDGKTAQRFVGFSDAAVERVCAAASGHLPELNVPR